MLLAASSFAAPAVSNPEEPYPLATCPVTGAELGSMGEPVVKVYDGREFRFCCASCPPKAEADPDKYLKEINEAIAEQQLKHYPVDSCLISGQGLESMDNPADYIYNNRLVRFCCAGCIDNFLEDPALHLGKLDAAANEAQKENYPFDYCLVSGDELGGEMGDPIEYVQGNRLYRLCCKGCVKSLREDPVMYRTMLDDALAGKEVKRPEGSGSKHEHGGDGHEKHDGGHDDHKDHKKH
jgi:YHS domain-containing protein